MIHKSITNSSVQDDAPYGARTAICLEIVDSVMVNNLWKKTECKECLKLKKKRKNNEK